MDQKYQAYMLSHCLLPLRPHSYHSIPRCNRSPPTALFADSSINSFFQLLHNAPIIFYRLLMSLMLYPHAAWINGYSGLPCRFHYLFIHNIGAGITLMLVVDCLLSSQTWTQTQLLRCWTVPDGDFTACGCVFIQLFAHDPIQTLFVQHMHCFHTTQIT